MVDLDEAGRGAAWFRALFDAAPDAMIIVGPTGVIEAVNRQTERLFGWTREALLGQPIEVLVPMRARAGHVARREGYAQQPRVREMGNALELSGVRRDGSEFPVEISLSPVESPDGRYVAAAVRDMTDRRRTEHELRAANQAKDEFLANMSHELRTPLNAILGFSELLEAGAAGPLNETQIEYQRNVSRSASHLLDLIRGLLELSRATAGKLVLHPEPLDMRALVEAVCGSLQADATERKVTLTATVAESARPAQLDPVRTRQILYNLVSNGLKFTPAGGAVTVRVESEGAVLRIDVEDTGIGIAPDDLPRLFQRFQQLDSGPAKQHAGTGLGLALTRELVAAMGGRMEVRSVVGVGSTFSALVPRGLAV